MENRLGKYGLTIHPDMPPLDVAHLVHVGVMTMFGFIIGYLVKKALK